MFVPRAGEKRKEKKKHGLEGFGLGSRTTGSTVKIRAGPLVPCPGLVLVLHMILEPLVRTARSESFDYSCTHVSWVHGHMR